MNNKILIAVPGTSARGGITNYYEVLKDEFSSQVEYFERGARSWPNRNGFISEIIRAVKDFKSFKKRIKKNDVILVKTTTSLGLNAIIRDGLFIRCANRKNIKTIVFFRGWSGEREKWVEKRFLWFFKYLLFRADAFITLSESAKNKLISWGYSKEIFVETTLVDKRLITNISESFIERKFSNLKKTKIVNLLYLSRIERKKGIYDLLEAFITFQKKITEKLSLNLSIFGDGSQQSNIQKWVLNNNATNIIIKDYVEGDLKKKAFQNAHIFVFPSHGEGMPNAVLEAMGFGLPIITTPVGGIVDFFVPGENGYFVQINDPITIVNEIETLLCDLTKMSTIALNNYNIAQRRFRSDLVASRIEGIFQKVIKK